MQKLFAAGIGACKRPEIWKGISAVYGVYERDARLSIPPRSLNQLVEKLFHCYIQLVCHRNRNIEVPNLSFFFFAVDKIKSIGVVHPHHGHIRAMTALLLNGGECGVVHAQERNRPRCSSPRLLSGRISWPHFRQIKAKPTSCLLQKRCVLKCLEDALHGVMNGQDHAVCNNGGVSSRVGKSSSRRGVFFSPYDIEELLGGFGNKLLAFPVLFLNPG